MWLGCARLRRRETPTGLLAINMASDRGDLKDGRPTRRPPATARPAGLLCHYSARNSDPLTAGSHPRRCPHVCSGYFPGADLPRTTILPTAVTPVDLLLFCDNRFDVLDQLKVAVSSSKPR